MALTSKKKKQTKSKSGSVKKINPFELKFNRVKHNIIGKKTGNAGVGHPGLSKKRAYEKRAETLGVEHSQFGKVNKFVDKRIAGKDGSKTEEEKASLRFTAERLKNFNKISKFNLNDDDEEEVLTHGGKTLTDIQKYERTMASDDEEDIGNIGADIVKNAHFGGGSFEPNSSNQPQSRKDLIADLIAKTKHARQEKQEAKDEQETITDNLDEKYRKLMGKVQQVFRPVGATKDEKFEKDDYDILAHSLKVDADARATPAERTKSDKERAADEVEKLKELERMRIARMNAKKNKDIHISADDDVGYTSGLKSKSEKEKFEVRFDQSGSIMERDKIEKASIKKVAIDSDDEVTDEEDDDEEEEEEMDDLLEDEEDEDEEDSDEDEEKEVKPTKKSTKSQENQHIPFVFDMPKSYKEFSQVLSKYALNDVPVVLERMVKCHHPGLKEGNKKLLAKLFLFTLRFFDEISSKPLNAEIVTLSGDLSKSLYEIMLFDVEYAVRCVRALIRQHWKERTETHKKQPVRFALIALLRLISSLFPVSDIWHPVCSPAFVLANLATTSVQITSVVVLSRQIFLATILGDYVEDSKRYLPEVMAFLQGSLLLAVKHDETERFPTNSFPVSLPHRQMLYIEKKVKTNDIEPLSLTECFNDQPSEDSDVKKCRIIRALVALIQKFRVLYAVHENSFTATFRQFLSLLERLPVECYPTCLAEEVEVLVKSMKAECDAKSRLTQLSQVKTEKSMVKMLEPCFEYNFDPERPRLSRDSMRKGPMAEKKKLQHLYKKDMRGAIKELRKDAKFINRKHQKDTMAKDRDRKQKTKVLMQGLQVQQGDWNKEKFENQKKKKKF